MGNINERFRWARTDRDKVLSYTLFMLAVDQPSMVNNMNIINMGLDPQSEFQYYCLNNT